jgi:hypothetical protein
MAGAIVRFIQFHRIYHGRSNWYNFGVPTPFYHLSVAEELRRHPALPEAIRVHLEGQWGDFLLGNVSPDVQVVSRQERQATHFFTLPLRAVDEPPWERMLKLHPSLARRSHHSPDRLAFLGGYLCHLQADWLWVRDIFSPVFGKNCTWNTFAERLYLHNVLRTYLDRQVMADLPAKTGSRLRQGRPGQWLPFVEDAHL